MSLLRYENVNWSIPFLFNNLDFFDTILDFLATTDTQNPIKNLYGHIRCKWNGNQASVQKIKNVGGILQKVSFYKINPVINFSNYHLEENDLKDKYCNDLLDYGVSIKAMFIISSDLLYDYIKNKYPNARLISSDIKSLYELERGKEIEYYKNLYDKYEMITLSPNYVKDGFLKDIEQYSDLSKFEIIVNNTCIKNCSKMKEHNESIENFEMGKSEYIDFMQQCPKIHMNIKDGISNTLVLSRQELDNLVNNAGIKNLRINEIMGPSLSISSIVASYIFQTIGNYQHVGFRLDPKLK